MGRVGGDDSRRWMVGTEEQFVAFYDATVRDAFRYASRLVGGDRSRTEDLVQDVFLALLRQVQAGTVGEVGVGWVMIAIRHRFLDQIRAAGREERRLRLVWSRPPAESSSESTLLAGVPLSDRERAALTLRYVDDLPVADVAAHLGVSVRATESLLARARTRIRTEVRDA